MTETLIRGRRVFYWDPRRNHLPIVRRFEVGPRVGNFGDLLGPLIVQRVVGDADAALRPVGPSAAPRLFAIGSVMHFARDGDTVWGTGVNGKIPDDRHVFDRLDVRAVRGPLTREWLARNKGIDAPEVYGDPALLLPEVAPEAREWAQRKERTLGVVPNFHDIERFRSHPGFIDPRRPPWEVIRDILASEAVAASSLHGVIVAEAFGIPAALLPPGAESPFKYRDYAGGTGRSELVAVDDVAAAEATLRGRDAPLTGWDPRPLLAAFPAELFAAA